MHITRILGKSELTYKNQYFPNNSLIGHSLAVAACAKEIFSSPAIQQKLRSLGWDSKYDDWLIIMIALHDIGKCAPEFQLRIGVPEDEIIWDEIRSSKIRDEKARTWYHGEAGFKRYTHVLIKQLISKGLLKVPTIPFFADLLNGTCAHHNTYSSDGFNRDTDSTLPSSMAVQELFDVLEALITDGKGLPELPSFSSTKTCAFIHWTAGWAVLSDWFASEENNFQPLPTKDLHDDETPSDAIKNIKPIWDNYLISAQSIIREKSLFKPFLFERKNYAEILRKEFQSKNGDLNAIQKWAETTTLSKFTIIEAPMGVGKTEFAIILADRMIRKHWCSGLIFSLPTQSTANKIHDRLDQEIAGQFFHSKAILAHGSSGIRPKTDLSDTSSIDQLHYYSSGTKRAFLAPVSICTVDQVQKSIMRDKHSQIRAAALAQRCLIIDEIHAYDAYMSRQIESVLEFASIMNIPVILMSATLPIAIKKRFIAAYNRTKIDKITLDNTANYPRITTADLNVSSITGLTNHNKFYQLKRIKHTEIVNRAYRFSQQGKTVAIICNTVKSATKIYEKINEKLKATTSNLLLFHAHFTQNDRDQKETLVTDWFGKNSTEKQRLSSFGYGKILIATQVAEQSIDFDVDVMFSELCPIDLLLQRAGRLQRHDRGPRPDPILFVATPENHEVEWYKSTEFVYPRHDILEKTQQWLGNEQQVHLPEGISQAVDKIYEDLPLSNQEEEQRHLSDALVFHWEKSLSSNLRSMIKSNKTRLGDPSYSILLLTQDKRGHFYLPFHDKVQPPTNKHDDILQHNIQMAPYLIKISDREAPAELGFGKTMNKLKSILQNPDNIWGIAEKRLNYQFVILGSIQNGIFVSDKEDLITYSEVYGYRLK